ncbi:MAG: UTP--glucose-1-phosphate uridylyltransferase [Micrococcales bacterium]|nr:UTP--glucose-1-phosphate uridylyltransferase [Micrococcales bacterium]
MAMNKAVIPAAGLSTRFLPATKTIHKALLPIVDIPVIEYVVAEAAQAGLRDVLIVTGEGRETVVDHFAPAPDLEQVLEEREDLDRLAAVRRTGSLATVRSVQQDSPRGLGHAIACAHAQVGDEPFAVLLPDDLLDEGDPHLQAMLRVRKAAGGSVLLLMRVPHEEIGRYGCAGVASAPPGLAEAAGLAEEALVTVTTLVEKPAPEDAPSDLAIIGRYVLDPAIFPLLAAAQPTAADEIQVTDSIARLASMPADQGGGVWGVILDGRRHDTGEQLGFLKAVVAIASDRADLGQEFRQWLAEFVNQPPKSRAR